jgi:hypothetical protein
MSLEAQERRIEHASPTAPNLTERRSQTPDRQVRSRDRSDFPSGGPRTTDQNTDDWPDQRQSSKSHP